MRRGGALMKKQPAESPYYSTRDLAKLLGVDDSTVKRWADLGEIPCYKTLGGHRRFTPETVKDVTARLSARISAQPLALERTPGRR
jgi:excisionase family DNA binding protein